jgi:DHA1 family multidrug resistance protein-like MFS transporter/DHA1 family quinolone resistance protein-like MFS transporter
MSLLVPSAFVASLAIGIVNLAMLFIVKERFHAGPRSVGIFTALWSIAYFVGCIGLKRASDRMGPRLAMTIMNLGTAAVFAAFLAFPSLGAAFAAYAVYGLLTALFWPPLMAWLSTGLEGQALSKATNGFSLAWSSGGAFAPYIAGLLCEIELSIPIYVGMGLFALVGLSILATGKAIPGPQPAALPGGDATTAPEVDRSTSLRYPAWIGVFLIYAVLAVFFNIFPLFAKDELALSESRIGLLLLIRASFAAFGFWALGRLEFWHFRKPFIVLAVFLLLAVDLVFLVLRSPLGFALGLAALGIIQALCYNASIFYGASGAKDRAGRMTIHEALLTVGQILGSIGGGAIYQSASWSTVFVQLALLIALGLVAQVILLARRTQDA